MSTDSNFMDDSFSRMRDYIMVTESLIEAEYGHTASSPEPEEEVSPPAQNDLLIEEINDVVFRLRAFTESAEGDIGLGVEMGMQRAADMIEHVLNRHTQGE